MTITSTNSTGTIIKCTIPVCMREIDSSLAYLADLRSLLEDRLSYILYPEDPDPEPVSDDKSSSFSNLPLLLRDLNSFNERINYNTKKLRDILDRIPLPEESIIKDRIIYPQGEICDRSH